MKNFKKIIILSISVLGIVAYFIYDYLNNTTEVIEEDIFIDESIQKEEINTIILHITGEVNVPRNY